MGFNILIVDDSSAMRSFIKRVIQISCVNVDQFFEASNGKEALDNLNKNWIDLVITDIYMPEMDGEELVREMKKDELFSSIPVFVVSSESREKKINGLKKLGIVSFIKKPFRPENIKEQIEEALGVNEYGKDDSDLEGCDF